MRSTFAMVLAIIFISGLALGSPRDARYREDFEDVFWFLVVSDSHVGENLSGGTQDTDNLRWVTGEAYQVVRPRFIFHCGDIVDGTNGGIIPIKQWDSEWQEYRGVVDDNGMNADVLVDLPGNHDQYTDKGLTHYRKYSIQGSKDDQTQHSIVHQTEHGLYHFMAIATPANDGAPWPADNASIDAGELDFIRQKMRDHADANLHLFFGHHPIKYYGDVLSNALGEGTSAMLDLFKQYEVVAYFFGHTHAYYMKFHDGTLFANVTSLGKSDSQNVMLAAIDHDSLSVRAFDARKWPMVLITAPSDKGLGDGNPYAYFVPQGWKNAPVRALAFGWPKPLSVAFRVDNGTWTEMIEVREGLYQGAFDASALQIGDHKLRVRANPWTDADHEITFEVREALCSNGKDDDNDGLTDEDDPGCEGPWDNDEFNEVVQADEGLDESVGGEEGNVDEFGEETGSNDMAEDAGSVAMEESQTGEAVQQEDVTHGADEISVLDVGEGDAWETMSDGVQELPQNTQGGKGGGCSVSRKAEASVWFNLAIGNLLLWCLWARRRRRS
jgi:predicted phosphodiesterase